MTDVLVPRPATTVVVLRDADDGVEVLMVRRNLRSDFVGGAYVFPGGAVDSGDGDPEILIHLLGPPHAPVPTGFSSWTEAATALVAGVRELFEEAGILLATARSTEPLELATWRQQLADGTVTFSELLRDADLEIDATAIVPIAHWITPEGPSRRYDTWFLVARAPADQVARRDDEETVAECWIRPRAALDAHQRGDFSMIFPTIRTLEQIERFVSVDEALSFARSISEIRAIQPRLVERDGEIIAVLPDGEGPGVR